MLALVLICFAATGIFALCFEVWYRRKMKKIDLELEALIKKIKDLQ